MPVDPLLTRLTEIDDQLLAHQGLPLVQALEAFYAFSQGDMLLSWGTDDVLTLSTSLFVQGLLSPIPAHRFRSAVPLLLAAGEDEETVLSLRSNTLCAHYGLASPGAAHDARADAASVAIVLSHLLADNRLNVSDFKALGRSERTTS